jgi:hypothetical protein
MLTGNPKPILYNLAALLNLTSINIVPPDYGLSPVMTMLQNQNHLSLFLGFHISTGLGPKSQPNPTRRQH